MPNLDAERMHALEANAYNANGLEEHTTETDHVLSVEVHRNRRILYFSDGTMEAPSSSDSDNEYETDVPDKSMDVAINEQQLPFVPRLKHKAAKVGSNILAGIDYIGGGLASFLGITTPKYGSESEIAYGAHAARAEENANEIWQQQTPEGAFRDVITTPPGMTAREARAVH